MKVIPKPREYQAVFFNGENCQEICDLYDREYAHKVERSDLMGLTRIWIDGGYDSFWIEDDKWYVKIDELIHVHNEDDFFAMYEVV